MLDLSFIIDKLNTMPADQIKINNVENMSIFELFKAIDKKIEERDK